MKTVFVLHLDDIIILGLLAFGGLGYAGLVVLDFLTKRRDRKRAEAAGKLSS